MPARVGLMPRIGLAHRVAHRHAAMHDDGLLRIRDVAILKVLLALDPEGHWIDRFSFSKDGRRLVGGAAGSPVLAVWDATPPAK